jgi:hypothetical protein
MATTPAGSTGGNAKDSNVFNRFVTHTDTVLADFFVEGRVPLGGQQSGGTVAQQKYDIKDLGIFLWLASKARGELSQQPNPRRPGDIRRQGWPGCAEQPVFQGMRFSIL